MTKVRRIVAAVALAGFLAVLPVSAIALGQSADQTSVAGGQGSWPFKK